jgi:hypothetical protein
MTWMQSKPSSQDKIRRAIERTRALYRADPQGFERETDRLAKGIERPEPPSTYEWEPDADPHERSIVERRMLIDAIRRIDASERAFPDEPAHD